MAGPTQFARDDVGSGTQILLHLRFQQQAAVVVELGRHQHRGRGDDEQADGDADHQLDQRQAALPPAGQPALRWSQSAWRAPR